MKRYYRRISALFVIALIAIPLFPGCEPPAKTPCLPKANPAVRVVWFHAEWCGPCKRQAPTIEKLKSRYTIIDVDIDQNPQLAGRFSVRAVPTYVVTIDGKEWARTNDAEELRRLLGR